MTTTAVPTEQGAAADSVPCSCGSTPAIAAAATEPMDAPFPVPPYPPREWFNEKPDWLTPETKLAVDESGRVAGYFYHAGQCLLYRPDACPKPSPTYYAAFHQSEVICEDGEAIIAGVIGNNHGHANPYARVDAAQAHYQDPSQQMVSCRAYDDEYGGYILGAVVPTATYGDVALLRRSPLSGDWRHMPQEWWDAHGIQGGIVRACEGYDCIGPTLVTRPGLPIVRQYAINNRAAAILGGVGGIQLEEDELMAESAPVVVHQHFHGEAPGPHPRQAATEAMLAADPPPQAPPAKTAEDDAQEDDAKYVSQEDFNALVDRVQAIEDLITASQDAEMAALEASVTPLPERVSS